RGHAYRRDERLLAVVGQLGAHTPVEGGVVEGSKLNGHAMGANDERGRRPARLELAVLADLIVVVDEDETRLVHEYFDVPSQNVSGLNVFVPNHPSIGYDTFFSFFSLWGRGDGFFEFPMALATGAGFRSCFRLRAAAADDAWACATRGGGGWRGGRGGGWRDGGWIGRDRPFGLGGVCPRSRCGDARKLLDTAGNPGGRPPTPVVFLLFLPRRRDDGDDCEPLVAGIPARPPDPLEVGEECCVTRAQAGMPIATGGEASLPAPLSPSSAMPSPFGLGLGLIKTKASPALPGEQLCRSQRTILRYESSEVLRACPPKEQKL
ncbi:hypothetical protein THAOC_26041, partial [Thalassiosira oceanica]